MVWANDEDAYVVLADDYPSIQDALSAAVSNDVPVVRLNPASTYTISSTLIIPDGVVLDGGFRGFGALRGAIIKAAAELNPMIQIGNYAMLKGCVVDGNNQAIVGVLVQSNFATIEYNHLTKFANATGAAIRAGGALYTNILFNLINATKGYALESLQVYKAEAHHYYGINHGMSKGNDYSGEKGVLIEGLFSSYNDDFELTLEGDAVITLGGTVQSQLNLSNAYFELKKGTPPLVAIKVENSSKLIMQGCQVYGDEPNKAGSTAILCDTVRNLNITGNNILRWETGFGGSLVTGADILIGGNTLQNVDIPNALTNTANADISLMYPGVS